MGALTGAFFIERAAPFSYTPMKRKDMKTA